MLATQVNPPDVGASQGARAFGAAASRLEPVIRAWEATEDVRRRYLLVLGSSSVVSDTMRGGSASADRGESCGTCR